MSSFNSIVMVMIVIGNSLVLSWGQLSTDYYQETCPLALVAVKTVVALAIAKEKRMGASLLNLHFHDCFIQGCDGSILLDDTPTFLGEKTGFANNNSARGYDVVDDIKSTLEFLCPGVVSCADILAIAARDSIAILGGPKWNVKLGRRDSLTANFSQANSDVLPLPNASLNLLIDRFQDQGLSIKDMVALSGAHTIGQTRCISFRERIYNGTNIDVGFAAMMRANCPCTIGVGDNNLAPLDFISPTVFDNSFYVNLLNQEGLFVSDQILYNGGSTDNLVKSYSNDSVAFAADFVAAIIKMGDIRPLTGSAGEIRRNCRRVNS